MKDKKDTEVFVRADSLQDKYRNYFNQGFFTCFVAVFELYRTGSISREQIDSILKDEPCIKRDDIKDFLNSFTCNLFPNVREYIEDYLKRIK